MLTLLILVAIAYILIGCAELMGIAATCLTDGEPLPTLFESLCIVVGWGWFEYKTWMRKHHG